MIWKRNVWTRKVCNQVEGEHKLSQQIRAFKMQFYSSSTQKKRQQQGFQVVATEKQISPQEENPGGPPSQPDFAIELMEISSALNAQLIKNNQLIEAQRNLWNRSQLPQPSSEFQKKSYKGSERYSTAAGKSGSEANVEPLNVAQINQKMQQNIYRKRKMRVKESSEDEYQPDQEEYCREEPGIIKISESKNIPKNYSKAIFTFIKSHEELTKKVVDRFGEDYQEFMRALNSLGGHVNSIAQLQWLWGGQDNPYAKVYRILSLEYLRKHCLPYIFNSRVNVYAKHIKYRFRMLEGVAKPDNFTRMKEF